MLPEYIIDQKKSDRLNNYSFNQDLLDGNHNRLFNVNESEFKMNSYEYLCYDVLKTALNIKADLIWKEAPVVDFGDEKLQEEWQALRIATDFDQKLRVATMNLYALGESVVKIGVDENNETSQINDFQLSLYVQNPVNWFVDYNKSNPQQTPKNQTMIFEKDIFDGNEKRGCAYLLETHSPGNILYTSYYKKEGSQDQDAVAVLLYFEEEMLGVVGINKSKEDLEINYPTNCKYPLLQYIKQNENSNNFYGKSDFTLPVVSKVNALNRYANLADLIIVTNSMPKLLAGDELQNLLKKIIEEAKSNSSAGQPLTRSIMDSPQVGFLSSQTYLQSWVFKQLADTKVLPNSSRGAETKFLNNPFDLQQLRDQHEIFFKSLMNELGISEVFYNPSLSSGALSGVAYKRLMTMTLNEIENTKRKLEPFLKKVIYTMLELAKKNNLIKSEVKEVKVTFNDGLINDENEDLQLIIQKVQNQFMPLIKAIKIVNNVTEEEATILLQEMQNQSNLFIPTDPELNDIT